MGRLNDAAASFRRTGDAYPDDQVVQALAFAYAARTDEARSDFESARRGYDAALRAWSAELGGWLALDLPVSREAAQQSFGNPLAVNPALLERDAVERRAAQLTRSAGLAGGIELERGRWLLSERRPQEAAQVLGDVALRFAGEPSGHEAAGVLKRARLDAALDAAADPQQRGEALRELESLMGDPLDSVGGMAAVIHATCSGRGWNASDWPAQLPAFLMAPATLEITTADGLSRVVEVARQPPGLTNVVFVSKDEIDFLTRAVSRLGGVARREPTGVMEVPNQPIGGAREIIQWWDQYFPARPGHWSGFEILSYPAFSRVEFTNAERTRARVPFAIGYSGSTVVLEKVNGVWTMKALEGFWIM